VASYHIHITPHVGKLGRQLKQSKMVAPLEIVPGSGHVDARETRRQSGSILWTLKTIFLSYTVLRPNQILIRLNRTLMKI
jgi:hypothetical protein